MKRARLLFGVVALALTAGTLRGAVSAEVTLFGQKYTVTRQSRTQTYKNGAKITVQTPGDDVDTKQKANLSFQQMVQVRNRLVSAYHDIMNMQV